MWSLFSEARVGQLSPPVGKFPTNIGADKAIIRSVADALSPALRKLPAKQSVAISSPL